MEWIVVASFVVLVVSMAVVLYDATSRTRENNDK